MSNQRWLDGSTEEALSSYIERIQAGIDAAEVDPSPFYVRSFVIGASGVDVEKVTWASELEDGPWERRPIAEAEYPADIAVSFGESSIDTFRRVFGGLRDLVVTLMVDGTESVYTLDDLMQLKDEWAFRVVRFNETTGENEGPTVCVPLSTVSQITIH